LLPVHEAFVGEFSWSICKLWDWAVSIILALPDGKVACPTMFSGWQVNMADNVFCFLRSSFRAGFAMLMENSVHMQLALSSQYQFYWFHDIQ